MIFMLLEVKLYKLWSTRKPMHLAVITCISYDVPTTTPTDL